MTEFPTFTLDGRAFVIVPAALAEAAGLGKDPAAEKRRATGERLRSAREAAGLSQTELATKLACGQPNVSAVENGRDPAGPERVAAWLAACGLPADWTPPKARRRSKAER